MKNMIIEEIIPLDKYTYAVIGFTKMGHYVGYLALSSRHPAYGIELDLDVHGGVTFCDKSHLNEAADVDILNDFWLVGFDCGHSEDKPNYIKVIAEFEGIPNEEIEYLEFMQEQVNQWNGTFKNADYVKEELLQAYNKLQDILDSGYFEGE